MTDLIGWCTQGNKLKSLKVGKSKYEGGDDEDGAEVMMMVVMKRWFQVVYGFCFRSDGQMNILTLEIVEVAFATEKYISSSFSLFFALSSSLLYGAPLWQD